MAKTVLRWSMKKVVWMIVQILNNQFDCFMVIEGNRGLGKTQTKGSKVLMSNGKWKNIEDIKIGDEIISPQKDKSFTYEKVIETHNRFEKDVYEIREVTREKKLLYTCAGNHEIPILRISHPRKRDENGKCTNKRLSKQVLDLWDAKKISKSYTQGSHVCSFSTPLIEFKNKKDPEIDPYCLGAWLGDGHFQKDLGITSMDKEIIEEISKHHPIMNILNKDKTNAKTYRFSILGAFAQQLKDLNLRFKKSGNKFIPKNCLLASAKYRFKLLAGLVDTDGYVMKNKDNHIELVTKSKQLAEDIKNLVFSLGGNSNIKKIKKKCQNNFIGEYYQVKISFLNPKIIPLVCKRKKLRLGNQMKHPPTHAAIKSIKTKSQQVYGFGLTGKSKWYVTDNYMVTHNSTLAIHLTRQVSREFKKKGSKDYRFNWKNSFIYTKKETKRFWHKWRSSGIADEMINVTFNRDFYNEDQKDIIKMINMNRDHCNLFIACVPQFQALDNQIKNLCKIRITVVRRGLAIIQTPNRTIYVKDKWDQATNEKIERGWLQKGITKPHYSKLTTFRGVMAFSKLHPSAEKKYQETKNEKRNLVAREEMGIDIDEEIKDPVVDAIKRLKDGKVRNGVFLDGIAVANNFDPATFKNKLRSALNKEGVSAKLTDYYWDKGKKKKDYNPVQL